MLVKRAAKRAFVHTQASYITSNTQASQPTSIYTPRTGSRPGSALLPDEADDEEESEGGDELLGYYLDLREQKRVTWRGYRALGDLISAQLAPVHNDSDRSTPSRPSTDFRGRLDNPNSPNNPTNPPHILDIDLTMALTLTDSGMNAAHH